MRLTLPGPEFLQLHRKRGSRPVSDSSEDVYSIYARAEDDRGSRCIVVSGMRGFPSLKTLPRPTSSIDASLPPRTHVFRSLVELLLGKELVTFIWEELLLAPVM